MNIKLMHGEHYDKLSNMKGVDDNDDDDHEYNYYHYYHHQRHRHHYHHISSIGYVILTLHLNLNHRGTSGHILVSLRKDHLSD